jgi:hypothetical protein
VLFPAVHLILRRNNYNAVLTFNKVKRAWGVDQITKLPTGAQPQITVEELIDAEKIVRADGKLFSFWLTQLILSNHRTSAAACS